MLRVSRHADEQRDQLDDAEEDGDADQAIEEDPGFISQRAEQRGVQHRRPGIHQHQPSQRICRCASRWR